MNPPALLPPLVFTGAVLAIWAIWRISRLLRSQQQEEPAAPSPESKVERSGCLGAFLFLFVVWLIVEVVSIHTLGNNAQNTFQNVSQSQTGGR